MATPEQVEELAKWLNQKAWPYPNPWESLSPGLRVPLMQMAEALLNDPPPVLVRYLSAVAG